MKKHTEEFNAPGEAWAESVDRFPDDTLLRKHGYKIHSRKNWRNPTWELGGNLVSQQIALGRIKEN